MLQLHNLSYIHPDKSLLFDQLNLNLRQHDKIALIGNNGSGKSTLLKIIAGKVEPTHGLVKTAVQPYYLPQVFGQLNHLSVARALGIDQKFSALKAILNGDVSDDILHALDDDWTIEERAIAALSVWQLEGLSLSQRMNDLSGGQKTKVFLAGMSLHKPEFMLLDEPTNHLDLRARKQLYDFILQASATMIVVSHDRTLLNLLPAVCELTQHGIREYGGNYEFYEQQKKIELNALSQDILEKEKAMRKAKEKERETKERQQKSDARGKAKQEKAGVARIMMNTLRNKAENSTHKLKTVHAEKIAGIYADLKDLRSGVPAVDKIRFGFDDSELHKGKVLFSAKNIQFRYDEKLLWKDGMTLLITSGERIALTGINGAGKTTLIKIITGELDPTAGSFFRAENKIVYIDQDYSLLEDQLEVYEQVQQWNTDNLSEGEVKTRLTRFLFNKERWDSLCSQLSGGERMRLMLCCLTVSLRSPDIIILDEPTNNLDIQHIDILINAICGYNGTLIVVSHDQHFLSNINIKGTIELPVL